MRLDRYTKARGTSNYEQLASANAPALISGKDAPRKQDLVRLAEIAIFLFMRVRLPMRARSGISYI
jgi:hypothetical protein